MVRRARARESSGGDSGGAVESMDIEVDMSASGVCERSLFATQDLFPTHDALKFSLPVDKSARDARMAAKVFHEYRAVRHEAPPTSASVSTSASGASGGGDSSSALGGGEESTGASSAGAGVLGQREQDLQSGIVKYTAPAAKGSSALALLDMPSRLPKPEWHAPWTLMRVISGHTGQVRCGAVEPSNEWFATGSADRTIMVWDLASGTRKVTLTGHIATVRGVAVSSRQPYLFSVGEDKQVKCWDLEYNQVIRHYHGHLSGVYCCALHPTLDVLFTGGRDASVRVWDIRTKAQVHVLTGHKHIVMSIASQPTDPQVITGSMDSTIRTWDLAAGKCDAVLTNHKKGVRALALHQEEYSFVSASADNLKKWKLPEGRFLHNLSGHRSIVNSMAVNTDNVLVSGGDNGSLHFWDWKTGHNFQQEQTRVQPGSLESEAGIFSLMYDKTGCRLISCEADKTIKIWKEDEEATPETHPGLKWQPSLMKKRW